jgi:hypothetical protein
MLKLLQNKSQPRKKQKLRTASKSIMMKKMQVMRRSNS